MKLYNLSNFYLNEAHLDLLQLKEIIEEYNYISVGKVQVKHFL